MVKVKIGSDSLESFLKFLVSFKIRVLLSWKDDSDFFDTYFFYLDLTESDGITCEEKTRLVDEFKGAVIKRRVEL